MRYKKPYRICHFPSLGISPSPVYANAFFSILILKRPRFCRAFPAKYTEQWKNENCQVSELFEFTLTTICLSSIQRLPGLYHFENMELIKLILNGTQIMQNLSLFQKKNPLPRSLVIIRKISAFVCSFLFCSLLFRSKKRTS